MNTRLRYGILATVLGALGVTLSVLGFLAVRSPLAARLATASDGVASLLTGLAFTACAVTIVLHYGRRSTQLAAAYHELHRVTLQRERSEAALRESERFTRATLDAMHARIAVLDADGVIMAVNRAWRADEHPFALDAGMCDVGSHYLALCEGVSGSRAADAQCVADAIREIMSGARADCIVESRVPPTNDLLVTRISRFAGRGPLRLVVAHQLVAPSGEDQPSPAVDDTRLEEALTRERELRANEEAMHAETAELVRRIEERTRERDRFFTLPFDLLCIANQTHFTRVNPAFTEVLGYSADELTACPYLEFVHPDDRDAMPREAERPATGDQVLQFVNRWRHRDGSWRWLSWTAVTESPDCVYAYARDVTTLRLAEDEHRHAEESRRDLVAVHRQMEDHVETLEQALAARARELTAANRELEQVKLELERVGHELRAADRGLDEATRALEVASHELEQATRQREAFSTSVATDLHASLRAVDASARSLHDESREQLGAGGQRHLGIIRESTSHMAQAIDALLDLSRIDRRALDRTPIDMTTLARTVADEISRTHETRDVAIVVEGLAPAVGDATLLRQLFANLVGNAFTYTSKVAHPCIDVGSVEAEGTPVYYVRDNGAGFDMRDADRLFHVSDAPSELAGTGIGLALVQRIVDRHGGRVWAEGRVGDGATFFFTLGPEADGETPVPTA